MLGMLRPVAEESDNDETLAQSTSLAISGITLSGTDPGRLPANVHLRKEPQGGLGLHDHGDVQTGGHSWAHRDFEHQRRGGHVDRAA
jgi:hypothetical protein